ncbi:family 16 glycosylhydrolase [Microbacterium sp. WCS2018Hpa-23]|uniref:glycoside hydrolase family 16 protein n=1 Tax=Microbacterium sp. WCS2018Hpa-23 TaxID=3073634 RepID=UPI002883122D|nr:family 16 glycosylhydrolase [Microbacterium sp. WCS2018Hpa-23]
MSISRKTSLGALGAAILTLSLLSGAPATAADDDLPGWVFQEDVDLSDSSRWTLETGQSSNTSSYDIPSNVSFGSTGLTVRGAAENRSSAAYTSGDAKGLDIVIPNYSRVEAVGSVPFGPGLWPALMWLRPLDSAHGEIDLMEVFGDDARPAATLHNEYGSTHRSLQGSVRWEQLPHSDPTGTHTYVMEKTPNRIVISVDGHVMLDAGPEDVRPGFDWKAIFERPTATWYPRVTLQIGCPPAEPDCGIGLPASGWKGGEMKLESLKVWRMANPGEQPPVVEPPVVEPPVVEPPVVEPPVVEPPVVEPPVVEPPVVEPPAEEAGAFALRPGQEIRHDYTGAETAGTEASVTFSVPENIGTGVMYHSLQALSSDDGKNGYRATVTLKASGSIRLTLAKVTANRSVTLKDVVVAGRGTYEPGDDVRVSIRVIDGTVLAKAWAADANEPDWQVTVSGGATASTGDGIRILGYLSKVAPNAVTARWSELSAQLR